MSTSRAVNGLNRVVQREGQKCLRQRSIANIRSPFSTTSTRAQRLPSRTTDTLRLSLPSRFATSSLAGSRRAFSASAVANHGHWTPPKPGEEVYVTFIEKDGTPVKLAVSVGDDLLSIAQEHDIEMEGACEGSCSCSTCHVIVQDEAMFDKMEEAEDDENDMLDLAFGLTETSRLGCQIKMTKELDGLVVGLPKMTRNMQASDFKS